MTNQQLLEEIIKLSAKLQPEDGKPFINKVYIVAKEMYIEQKHA